MMKTVIEGGKRYVIDDKGLVIEAAVVEESQEETVEEQPLALGDRVEVAGQLGEIVSRISGVYGMTYGVRFDDGLLGEYLDDVISRTEVEKVKWDTPIEQVKADWEEYQKLPGITADEIDQKSALARKINITAKALVTDSKTSLSDQVVLDQMVIVTGTDLLDLKEARERVSLDREASYLEALPKYKIPNEVLAMQGMSREDASWLHTAAEDAETEVNDFDWESHLASEASSSVRSLTIEQLESDSFMEEVANYRLASQPLGLTDEKRELFANLLVEARKAAIEARKAEGEVRTAAVEEDLSDFDTSALYI
jgi:hypothetical protein